MSEQETLGDGLERLEGGERREPRPASRLAQVTRRTALTGGAAGLAAAVLEACGGGAGKVQRAAAAPDGAQAAGVFAATEPYKFTIVNHQTTSPFFTPTQNGAADACKLLGCTYQWTGSEDSSVTQMVNAINNAVSQKVSGIATPLTDPTAFDTPVENALNAGIPVLAYNSDVAGNPRLAYIGPDLRASGIEMGRQIVALLPHGGDIAIFASSPGVSNLQPRIEGINSVLKPHHGIRHRVVSSGSSSTEQLTTVAAFVDAHPTYSGFFAVDPGSLAAVGAAIQKYNLKQHGVLAGGCDLDATTEPLVAGGQLEFAIDQQPYLQGFMSILELYLYNVSDRLTGVANVDTGLKVVDSTNISAYNKTTSRFEGTSTAPGVHKVSS